MLYSMKCRCTEGLPDGVSTKRAWRPHLLYSRRYAQGFGFEEAAETIL